MDAALLKKILVEYPSGHEFSLQELYGHFPGIPATDLRGVVHAHTHRKSEAPHHHLPPIFHRIGADRYRVHLTPEIINMLFGMDGHPPGT